MTYFSVIAAMVILMNTYYLTATRDMIFASKQTFVQSQAALVATGLEEAFDTLDVDDVRRVMAQIEGLAEITYIVVTNEMGEILYDPAGSYFRAGFQSENIFRTLDGYNVFYAKFSEGAFSSSAFTPIMSDGAAIGAVYVHDVDTVQGALLIEMQDTLRNISILVVVFSIAAVLFTLWLIMRRINSILAAIKSVREGEYNYRVSMPGSDELALLGDEFNRLTERLRETDEIRRHFVANASHELKTPLASIRLLSDSILQNEGIERNTVHEFVEDIGTEAERLARTTEKLMTLTRLDSHLPLHHVAVDMRDAVNSTLRRLRPFASSKNLELECELEEACFVMGTEDAIDQIVYNLVENAIKYNKPGGKVFVGLVSTSDSVILSVADTGIGVPDEDLPYIFDRFYRVDKARSRDAGGSGLGLSIVRDTARELNGKVTAQQLKGGGMLFEVTFDQYNVVA